MSNRQPVDLYFIIDGERDHYRVWWHVPRVGDRIMLHQNGKEPDPPVYIVEEICWNVAYESDGGRDRLAVNIAIRTAHD